VPWKPWLGGYVYRRRVVIEVPTIITIIGYTVEPNDVSLQVNVESRVNRGTLTVPLTVSGQGTVSNIAFTVWFGWTSVNRYLLVNINLIGSRSVDRYLPVSLLFTHGTVDRRVAVNVLISYRRVVGSMDMTMYVNYRRNASEVLTDVYMDRLDTVNTDISIPMFFVTSKPYTVKIFVNLNVIRPQSILLPIYITVEIEIKVDNNNAFVVSNAIQF